MNEELFMFGEDGVAVCPKIWVLSVYLPSTLSFPHVQAGFKQMPQEDPPPSSWHPKMSAKGQKATGHPLCQVCSEVKRPPLACHPAEVLSIIIIL